MELTSLRSPFATDIELKPSPLCNLTFKVQGWENFPLYLPEVLYPLDDWYTFQAQRAMDDRWYMGIRRYVWGMQVIHHDAYTIAL